MKFDHPKTEEIIGVFHDISQIPRCSKEEDRIAEWLVEWGKSKGFEVKTDKVKNILIKVPASKGCENSPIVVLQGHMDMVCEKTKESNHDFTCDPIKFVYEGEWLTADETSLGADNGIALAMAMVAAVDKNLKHGPLELLFTVDEETGLTGANALEPGFIDGKILLNIDSEVEGVFTVGCAGGKDTHIDLPLNMEAVPKDYAALKISAENMKGGHSGVDIAMGKANAIKVLGRVLNAIQEKVDFRIGDFQAGTAHNAIPRDAWCLVYVKADEVEEVKNIAKELGDKIALEYKKIEPDLTVKVVEETQKTDEAVKKEDNYKFVNFLMSMPHGVESMSLDIEGLVETSNNFAICKLEKGVIKVLTSQRSSVVSRLIALTQRIESIGKLAGAKVHSGEGYPPWQPNMDSELLKTSVGVYKKLFKKEPVVEIIHAGLECGIIGDKNEGMDMLSIGPTIRFPHCPDEKIHIGTIGMVWDFLEGLIEELA